MKSILAFIRLVLFLGEASSLNLILFPGYGFDNTSIGFLDFFLMSLSN